MTSGRTSKLIRELDRTLVFGEYISSKHTNEIMTPMVLASLKFKSVCSTSCSSESQVSRPRKFCSDRAV